MSGILGSLIDHAKYSRTWKQNAVYHQLNLYFRLGCFLDYKHASGMKANVWDMAHQHVLDPKQWSGTCIVDIADDNNNNNKGGAVTKLWNQNCDPLLFCHFQSSKSKDKSRWQSFQSKWKNRENSLYPFHISVQLGKGPHITSKRCP
jgi:hypothetical protein